MQELVENEQVQWVRETLVEWLGRDDWKPRELIDLLQSYGLPVDSQEEPFLWLLRGLPLADELYAAKRKLACRAAELLLAEEPDETRPGDQPDQVLLNLLYLCAGLACADELAEPLYDVYQRRKLKGKWSGIDLCDALRAALTTNQIDRRLESVWQAMVEGEGDDFLPGDAEDGFEGLVFMPRSHHERGEPAWDAIGWALKVIGERLENEAEKVAEYQGLIERVTSTHPGYAWDVYLLPQVLKYEWPMWTVAQLPGSCARRACLYLEDNPNVGSREFKALIHQAIIDAKSEVADGDPIADPLEEAHRESLKYLCVGV